MVLAGVLLLAATVAGTGHVDYDKLLQEKTIHVLSEKGAL